MLAKNEHVKKKSKANGHLKIEKNTILKLTCWLALTLDQALQQRVWINEEIRIKYLHWRMKRKRKGSFRKCIRGNGAEWDCLMEVDKRQCGRSSIWRGDGWEFSKIDDRCGAIAARGTITPQQEENYPWAHCFLLPASFPCSFEISCQSPYCSCESFAFLSLWLILPNRWLLAEG